MLHDPRSAQALNEFKVGRLDLDGTQLVPVNLEKLCLYDTHDDDDDDDDGLVGCATTCEQCRGYLHTDIPSLSVYDLLWQCQGRTHQRKYWRSRIRFRG